MALFVCWVLFPVLLLLVVEGCGSLVEWLTGRPLRAGVRLPSGFALVIFALDLPTHSDATATLALPLALALATAGLILTPPWRRGRPDRWLVGGALFVFAAYGAPVVLTGHPTFLGYIKLDDTATWLAFVDRVIEHARTTTGLAPSSYEATLQNYFASSYPMGSFLPLALGSALVGSDPAWLVAPFMAFAAMLIGVAVHALSEPFLNAPFLRGAGGPEGDGARPSAGWTGAVVVALAAQPALLYAYTLWGGIKEIVGAALVAAFAACLPDVIDSRRVRAMVPAAVVTLAMLSALSAGGLVWLAPAAVLAAGIGLFGGGSVRLREHAAGIAVVVLVGAGLGAALLLGGYLKATLPGIQSDTELGNLIRPLDPLQVLGIWPAADFRLDPADADITHVLLAVLVLSAIVGLGHAVVRRRWSLPLYLLSAGVGALGIDLIANPWVTGKALAIASPVFVFAGLVGAVALAQGGRRVEAALVASAIAVGVLWSNVLAYREVAVAPYAQLTELEHIGERIAGQGPSLMTEYQPYGVRHFLRSADAEGASELRRRIVPLVTGGMLPKGATADIDDFALPGILIYRTLVLRRSPVASRPPSSYTLIFRGHYYDVWQRPVSGGSEILSHQALGDANDPGAVARCPSVLALARLPRATHLVAAVPAPPIIVPLTAQRHSTSLTADVTRVGGLVLPGAGTIDAATPIPSTGRYEIWVGGSLRGRLRVTLGARQLAAVRQEVEHPGEFVGLGVAELPAGTQDLRLRYDGADWRPGSAGPGVSVGPLVLRRVAPDAPLVSVAPAQARSLCGRRLDWVEAVAG